VGGFEPPLMGQSFQLRGSAFIPSSWAETQRPTQRMMRVHTTPHCPFYLSCLPHQRQNSPKATPNTPAITIQTTRNLITAAPHLILTALPWLGLSLPLFLYLELPLPLLLDSLGLAAFR